MKQLPPDTVRLLSSSQVVTSVWNVVKELMENSLDAGASSIDVKLENYGLDRIEVRDNGGGIKAADAPVMAVRHYTSKICSHEDLESLETYGFRGEALGSVCAVAEVTVTTKTEEDDVSTQYTLDLKGNIVSERPSHLGQGTTVSVQRLFKNLPVRRQYYSSVKKCKDELKKVQELLVAYAILKPRLRIVLLHNKVVVWQKSKVADDRSALLAALGAVATANLFPCHHRQEEPEIFLEGFFPKPGCDYSSTSSSGPEKTFIFVNNRPVQHKEIMKLLRQHYGAQYADDGARNRYPTLVLKITLSPSAVDVNVTPDKTQVLLQNKEAVLAALEALLISLYGFRPGSNPSTKSHETAPPDGPHEHGEESLKSDNDATHSDTVCQTSNTSSSSSMADDWIVNRIPLELESNFSLYDEESSHSCNQLIETSALSEPQKKPADDKLPAADTSKEISAEEWSGGTALTDPVSREPLQTVVILQPQTSAGSDWDKASSKRPLSAIAEKPASLTAYDLISSRATRAPLSPAALFQKETRAQVLRDKPTASLQDIDMAVQEKWKNLREEERKKYEDKARKHLELYDQKTKLALSGESSGAPRRDLQGHKRKAPPSNQQMLDQLFSTQPQKKKKKTPAPRPWQPLPCSVAALRLQLQRLSSQQSGAAPRGPRLVNRLASQSAWVILCGQTLMLLNPLRVEEALLFKRLLENHILPAVSLQSPIQLTDGNLGGAELTGTLRDMQKQSPELNGQVLFSDPRLVANGFKIKLSPAEGHLEVTAMADCVPFFGLEDLREILTAVFHRKAKTVRECRPLKVTNYLQGEAVRLTRQLPTNLSRDDVRDTVHRMEQQLEENARTCIHGRPFLHHLSDVPSTEGGALALLKPLEL